MFGTLLAFFGTSGMMRWTFVVEAATQLVAPQAVKVEIDFWHLQVGCFRHLLQYCCLNTLLHMVAFLMFFTS